MILLISLKEKQMKNSLVHALIYLVLFSIGFISGKWCISENRIADSDVSAAVIRDTIIKDVPVPVTTFVPVPADVDTAAILEMYFAQQHYFDTIVNYPELKVSLTDVITQNTLTDRTVFIDYQRPNKNRINAISIGADVSYYSMPVYVAFRRKRMTYRLGYDMFNQAVVGGLSFDLWQW